ncbi:hypothetical protein GLOIN_2v1615096, partial [Rhizophagus irregularis DAOM 181602=DAOM 197198]
MRLQILIIIMWLPTLPIIFPQHFIQTIIQINNPFIMIISLQLCLQLAHHVFLVHNNRLLKILLFHLIRL